MEYAVHADITSEPVGRFFRNQFVLSSGNISIVGYDVYVVGPWCLSTDLPVTRILDGSNEEVGVIVGWAFDDTGYAVTGFAHTDGRVEDWLYRHGGRYVAILNVEGDWRLYLDPMGSLATTYRAGDTGENIVAASTTSLAYAVSGRAHPMEAMGRDGYRPAGITAVEDMARLLPNHYLSLSEGSVFRHHYRTGIERRGVLPEDLQSAMAAVTSVIAGAGTVANKTYMTLAGGRDSRMLLAAAEPLLPGIELFTFTKRSGLLKVDQDVSIARSLARRLRRGIKAVRVDKDDPITRQQYLWRTGSACSDGKSRDFFSAARTFIEDRDVMIVGFGGEVSRATNRNRARGRDLRSPVDALEVVKVKGHRPEFVWAMERWLAGLDADPDDLMELLYLEQRMGCWASPHLYGFAGIPIVPFSHRRFVDTMLSLPVDFKVSDDGAHAINLAASEEVAGFGRHGQLLNPWDRFRNRLGRLCKHGKIW
jgi:hypothetical protein